MRCYEMRTLSLLVAAILMAGVSPMCAADEAKEDIPLYDGKSGQKIGDMCVNPKDRAKMVWVPAGKFLMGSNDWSDDQKPEREVYLDGYWMYKYEVTVAQYRKFCGETGRDMPNAPSWGWKDDHPMVYVRWQDAADYAKWAGIYIPTEAQWEKAARGTDGRQYPWGNRWDASMCNEGIKGPGKTQPVGSYPAGASPYGCMDMAGNVWEWCADQYRADYYKTSPASNPPGPSDGYAHVLRGGSWFELSDGALFLPSFLCANRYVIYITSYRNLDLGFRCAGNP